MGSEGSNPSASAIITSMIPKIRRPNESELYWNKEIKWVVVSRYECENRDLCYSLGDAIRFWLWHMGVPPKIAFKKWKRN